MKTFVLCIIALVMLSSAAWSASADLWPKWIKKEKIRAAYDFDHVDKRDHFAKLKAHGINTIFLSWDGDVDQPEAIKLLKKQADWCKDLDLHLFVTVKLCGGKDQVRYLKPGGRCYVAADGKALTKTPCPADPDFWDKVVTRRGKLIADFSKARPIISGYIIDDEMYGADTCNFPSYCYCADCIKEFGKSTPPGKIPGGMKAVEQLKPSEKFGWLRDKELLDEFQTWQAGAVEANCRTTEQTLHKVAPGLVIGVFHLDQLSYPRPSWARGLGTKKMPVLALPESTYSTGADPYLIAIPRNLAAAGAHAEFCPGIWPRQFPVETLAGQLFYTAQGPAGKYGAQESVGYWMWTTLALAMTPEELGGPDSPYSLPLPHEPWWEAIGSANAELERQSREAEGFVPRLELVIKQDSPQVALEKIGLWGPAKVELRPLVAKGQSQRPNVDPAKLRYSSVYYILATSGQQIRATFQSIRGGSAQQRPVYALTAPSGKVAAQGDVEPEKSASFEVKAEESGMYKLALNIEQHATSVAIDSPHSVLSLADGVHMVQSSVKMHFYVPEDVDEFTLEVVTPYALEQAKLTVFGPDGSEAATAETIDLTPARVVVKVKPEYRAPQDSAHGAVWSFQATPSDRGQFYSANVTLDPKLPQFLAESPEALLVPVSK